MKTLTLSPWQLAAWQAGRLKSVWVPIQRGGECSGTPYFHKDTGKLTIVWKSGDLLDVFDAPYAVGDVVELREPGLGLVSRSQCTCTCHRLYSMPVHHKIPCCDPDPVGRARVSSVAVRETASATFQDAKAAGCGDSALAQRDFCDRHPWPWSLVLGLEPVEVASDVG